MDKPLLLAQRRPPAELLEPPNFSLPQLFISENFGSVRLAGCDHCDDGSSSALRHAEAEESPSESFVLLANFIAMSMMLPTKSNVFLALKHPLLDHSINFPLSRSSKPEISANSRRLNNHNLEKQPIFSWKTFLFSCILSIFGFNKFQLNQNHRITVLLIPDESLLQPYCVVM